MKRLRQLFSRRQGRAGTSWDRIQGAARLDPKFANTGTGWDGFSDEALQAMAQADLILQEGSRQAEEEGREPYPDARAYDGAAEAWQKRLAAFGVPMPVADTKLPVTQTLLSQLPLTDAERSHWEGEMAFFRAMQERNPLAEKPSQVDLVRKQKAKVDDQPMSLESVIALAALCEKKLGILLRRKFPEALCDSVGFGLSHHECKHRFMMPHLTVDQGELVEALLSMDVTVREKAGAQFYRMLAMLDTQPYLKDWAHSVDKRVQSWLRQSLPTELFFFDRKIVHLREETKGEHRATTEILTVARNINRVLKKEGLGQIPLAPFEKEAADLAVVRERAAAAAREEKKPFGEHQLRLAQRLATSQKALGK